MTWAPFSTVWKIKVQNKSTLKKTKKGTLMGPIALGKSPPSNTVDNGYRPSANRAVEIPSGSLLFHGGTYPFIQGVKRKKADKYRYIRLAEWTQSIQCFWILFGYLFIYYRKQKYKFLYIEMFNFNI